MEREKGGVCLLDIDGTLVDSNDLHAYAWRDAFARNGFFIPLSEVRAMIGMGGDKIIPLATGLERTDALAEKIAKDRAFIFKKYYAGDVRAWSGSRELLNKLRASGFKLEVVSSAQKDELGKMLSAAKLIDLLTSVTEAENSKPETDIIEAALEKRKVAPADSIMIGDTPYDVAAANGAGVKIVAFTSGGWSPKDLVGATAIYEGPWDLTAAFDTSPFARYATEDAPNATQDRMQREIVGETKAIQPS